MRKIFSFVKSVTVKKTESGRYCVESSEVCGKFYSGRSRKRGKNIGREKITIVVKECRREKIKK